MDAQTFPLIPFLWIAVSRTLLLVGMGRLLMGLYTSHGFLFHASDRLLFYKNWLDFLTPYSSYISAPKYRAYLQIKISASSLHKGWSTDRFIASQMFFGGLVGISSALFFCVLLQMTPLVLVPLIAMGAGFPVFKISEDIKDKNKACIRELPYYLDYIALSISAGLDFNSSMDQIVQNSAPSALREEFRMISNNLKLGMTRQEALLEFEQRMNTQEVKTFVQTTIQSLKLGTNMADTLQAMAQALNTRRFQVAEEAAGKISAQMMIPLLLFVMPAAVIMLIGPIILGFLQTGF